MTDSTDDPPAAPVSRSDPPQTATLVTVICSIGVIVVFVVGVVLAPMVVPVQVWGIVIAALVALGTGGKPLRSLWRGNGNGKH